MRSTLYAFFQNCQNFELFFCQPDDYPHVEYHFYMENIMPKGHRHLTYEQRCQIDVLLQRKISRVEIGRQIGVHRSTITKEIQRNSLRGAEYECNKAHKKAIFKSKAATATPRKMTGKALWLIEDVLEKYQWSPDQISGWLARASIFISHETIYKHVWADKKNGGTLWKNLRHRGKKYNRRGQKLAGRGLIPGRVDIEERPQIVETKSRIGDWEGDTIVGKDHKGAILSHVDRHSKYTRLVLLPDGKAKSVNKACKDIMSGLAERIKTITYDNGKEFSGHKIIAKILDCAIYFAKPYHSWQRGLNEHTNGLVRQYFPKGTDFTKLAQDEIKRVEDLLNHRPRKCLSYKTPYEVFIKDTHTDVAFRC
jgi:IS30 family transposase